MKITKIYLKNIDYFRGIAIIFIVFGHCLKFSIVDLYENTTILGKTFISIANGGTTFFVYISGYLLHHNYEDRFLNRYFLLKKIKYVFIPYLIICSVDIIYYIIKYLYALIIQSEQTKKYLNNLKVYSYFDTYFLGHTEIAIGMWYIPFIMVLFSLSKLYLKFAKLKYKIQLTSIIVLILLSVVLHRDHNIYILSILQNLVYFSPIYLMGIFTSKYFYMLNAKMTGKLHYLLFFSFGIAIFQAFIGKITQINKFSQININNFDLMIIQKLLLSIFFIFFLMKLINKKIKFLELLAENSFGIFFLHGIYIWIINMILLKIKITYISKSIIVYILMASMVLNLSLITTILIRKIFPKKSKYIIGC